MDWIQGFTIIGTGVGIVGFIYMFLENIKKDLNEKISRRSSKVENLDQDPISKARYEAHMDPLYQKFVDLLKHQNETK